MNIIQFKVIETGPFDKRLDIEIDGKPLLDIMKAIELPMAEKEGDPHLAGNYGLMEIPSNPSYLLGGKDDACWGEYENKTELLVCTCGYGAHWSILCKIVVDNETVRWSEFEHMDRDEWDYSGFEGFVFSTAQYLDAIHAINADPRTKRAH